MGVNSRQDFRSGAIMLDMRALVFLALFVLFPFADARAQSIVHGPKFMGRDVTIHVPAPLDEYFPKGPASICIEAPPSRQCYTMPKEFGNRPRVELVEVTKGVPALLFSAATGGVSGWGIRCALLRLGKTEKLEDDFALASMEFRNASQHALWNEPSISDALIFVVADFVWGGDEAHYSPHRYTISAYVRKQTQLLDEPFYYLEDRYMTVRKYNPDEKTDILGPEKPEILARLKRVKAETERQTPAQR